MTSFFHQLIRRQTVCADLKSVWNFVCEPRNLARITPAHMNFQITSVLPERGMYPGMMIAYRVSPLRGLRLTWITEITEVEPLRYFVDEQRIGPYALWHHEHHLEAVEGGVLMTDIVSYKLRGGPVGELLHRMFVRRQLDAIFDFREAAMERMFGSVQQ